MKRSHLLILIFLIVAIGIVISLVYRSDTYSDFAEARKDPGKEFQIIGKLVKELPVVTDSTLASFSFYMTDDKGKTERVYYGEPEPKDFRKLEQVVVIGSWNDSVFMASSLLLKCPSKYNKDKVPEEFEEKPFGKE